MAINGGPEVIVNTEEEKRVAIGLGGHATMDPYDPDKSTRNQEASMRETIGSVDSVMSEAGGDGFNWTAKTHGSGPQTGLVLGRAEISEKAGMHELPLRYASMDLIGSLGMNFQYMLLNASDEDREVTVIPSSFFVDENTMEPIKPVGSPLDDEMTKKKREAGYVVDNLDGKGNRILVPSPIPLEMLGADLTMLSLAIRAKVLAIVAGAGGIAIKRDANGKIVPLDAVIDKDRSLGRAVIDLHEKKDIPHHTLVTVTDAPFMVYDFAAVNEYIQSAGGMGKISMEDKMAAFQKGGPIGVISVNDMRSKLMEGINSGKISGGAIAKIEAACDVVDAGAAKRAIICNTETMRDALLYDKAATIIIPSGREV